MSTTANMPKTIHQGSNIKRFREMRGLKQEGLAMELGGEWNQKKVSALEQKEEVDDLLLQQVANLLKVPVDIIKEFDEEGEVNYYNTFNDNSTNSGNMLGNYGTVNFNPLDELMKALEENKKLNEENKNFTSAYCKVKKRKPN